ncbi:MAG: hypothetical protein M1409_04550 [Actinobacteria bacterium]|nr:hypothetical protein [Actinomycetota bacterium]
MNKNYKKYTSLADRFPFIIFAVIIVIAVIIVLRFSAKFTFPFFSGQASTSQTQNSTQQTSQIQQYPMLISSPENGQAFIFANGTETVPIKVDLKEDISSTGYKLNIILSDGQIIKTISAPPYVYDWNPGNAADYSIAATLVDANNNIISSSNTVKFSVQYSSGTLNTSYTSNSEISATAVTTIDHSVTIDLQIEEGPIYVPNGNIYYFRVRAIVTGDPTPTVVFSKDDSHGVWGATIAQVNLRMGQSYSLGAIASNGYDSKNATVTLTAPSGTPGI